MSVKAWMLSYKLKLNDEKKKKKKKKAEATLVCSCQSINVTKAESIQTGGKSISLNPHIKKSRCVLGKRSVNGPAYQPFVSFSISRYEADCIHT